MKRARKALKKYFIPHEENDHKPHILRARSVAFVLIIAFAIEGALWFGAPYLATRSHLFGIVLINDLIDGTNQSRTADSEPSLVTNPLLMAAAQDKANDMATNNYFAHTSPTGLSPWYWFEKVGYNFEYAGENLAVNFSDSEDVTNAWMNSPEHRANILDANFTEIGMATATGTYEGHPAVYVVELFGKPVPPALPAEVPIAFANTAAAAGNPAGISATGTAAVGGPAPKPAKTSTPAVIASSEIATSGATTTILTMAAATSTTSATSVTPVGLAAGTLTPRPNPVERAAANPRQLADEIYFAIIALFAAALGLNIFIKIRIQHANVIFGGMIIILMAGLLIVLNQHLLAGVTVL